MRRLLSFRGVLVLVLLVLLQALAGLAWLQRTPLLAWYCVHRLAEAEGEEREIWLERVVRLDIATLPRLLDCLTCAEPRVCANAEAALARLAGHWGAADPRCRELAGQLLERFPLLSVPGRESVLEWQIVQVKQTSAAEGSLQAAQALLTAAAGRPEPGVRVRALALADVLIDRLEPGSWLGACRQLICKGLADTDAETRTRAIHLTLHAQLQGERDLLRQVVPLLQDPAVGVRRAALLAVGPLTEVINEDELLPLLHDADADVRRLCETALRGRGLQDNHLTLARLLSDSRASARLEVFQHLQNAPDLEPGVWLRRLSCDPSAAVRAAAVRAAASQTEVNLKDRLRQITRDDPSPTVRQLAQFYLKR